MKAYIINLKSAVDRKKQMEIYFQDLTIQPIFIDAVSKYDLTVDDERFSKYLYKLKHGKMVNLAELGCYLSHLKAMKAFLETEDTHAIILEDDAKLDSKFEGVIEKALKYSHMYDLLRLSGNHEPVSFKIRELDSSFSLVCNINNQLGSTGYLMNRHAAKQMLKNLLPMSLPYDHAFDREWCLNVKTLFMKPNLVTVNHFGAPELSQITDIDVNLKLTRIKRITVLFFKLYNELIKLFFRLTQILKYKLFYYKS
ncbi:MAG: glycosyltransferase family 25 protein [Pseudomonadota bacterium]|nr:glycosyltransferase family 25 protein [Pseudomonadota bacterium]